MDLLAEIAERRIREAMERGEFDDLPGSGHPLALPDDSMVPEDLRMAFHVLRTAGCLPPELELQKEIHHLGELLRAVEEDDESDELRRRLDLRILRLNEMRRTPFRLEDFPQYRERLLARLGGRPGREPGLP